MIGNMVAVGNRCRVTLKVFVVIVHAEVLFSAAAKNCVSCMGKCVSILNIFLLVWKNLIGEVFIFHFMRVLSPFYVVM